MAETSLKICVVGPSKSGKTLLCRALAEQPLTQGEYQPTAAVRIQEFSRQIGVDKAKVQFWDCSGSMQYQAYWQALGKDLDGVVLVIDASQPEQEKDLEQFYMNFAQPYSLTIKQCLVLAVQAVKEGSYGLGGWQGLQGKLSKINSGFVSINPSAPQAGTQESLVLLDKLLLGCLSHKKDTYEREWHVAPEQPALDAWQGARTSQGGSCALAMAALGAPCLGWGGEAEGEDTEPGNVHQGDSPMSATAGMWSIQGGAANPHPDPYSSPPQNRTGIRGSRVTSLVGFASSEDVDVVLATPLPAPGTSTPTPSGLDSDVMCSLPSVMEASEGSELGSDRRPARGSVMGKMTRGIGCLFSVAEETEGKV
eukprot:gene23940-9508_t